MGESPWFGYLSLIRACCIRQPLLTYILWVFVFIKNLGEMQKCFAPRQLYFYLSYAMFNYIFRSWFSIGWWNTFPCRLYSRIGIHVSEVNGYLHIVINIFNACFFLFGNFPQCLLKFSYSLLERVWKIISFSHFIQIKIEAMQRKPR